MLIGVDHLLALAGTHRDRNDLLGEDPVLLRGNRALVRRDRDLVRLVAGDAVLPAQVLRGLQHAARHRIVTTTGGGTAAREAVVHLDTATGATPAHVGRVERDVAHALGATGDHNVVVSVG